MTQTATDVYAPNKLIGGSNAASVMGPPSEQPQLAQMLNTSQMVSLPTQTLSMTDPTATGRRIQMIQSAFPMLAGDQGAMLSLAQLPVADPQLLDAVTSSLGQFQWKNQAAMLSSMSPDVQLGQWRRLPPSAQRAMQNAGYVAPNEHRSGGESFLSQVAGELGGAAHAVEGAVMDVGAPILDTMNTVQHLASHAYRTLVDVNESFGQGEFYHFLNPVDLKDAWQETGAAYFHKAQVAQAYDALANLAFAPLDGATTATPTIWKDQESVLELAKALTATTSDSFMGQSAYDEAKVIKDQLHIDPNNPSWQQAMQELKAWEVNPQMKSALRILDGARVSMGRDIASYVLHLNPQSSGYRFVSGLADGAIGLVTDPLLIAGKAFDAYKVGMYTLEDVSRLSEYANKLPSVQRALTYVADASQQFHAGEVNAWRRLADAFPHLAPAIPYLSSSSAAEPFAGFRDVVKAFEQPEAIKLLAEGGAEAPWAGKALLPTAGIFTPWRIQSKEFAQKAINFMADGAIYARADARGIDVIQHLIDNGVDLPEAIQKQILDVGGKVSWAHLDSEGKLASPVFDRVRTAMQFHVPEGSPLARGRDINLNPVVWGAQLLKGATTHVPIESALELGDSPRSLQQLRNFVELFGLSGLPSPVRNAMTDELLNPLNADPAARMQLVRNTIGLGLWSGGAMAEESGHELLDQFVTHLNQSYGNGSEIQGLGAVGTLIQGDRGYQLAIPSFADLAGQTKRLNVLRGVLGWTNNEMATAFMSKIWKPSVLLRVGFIPRAAGEELLLWAARSPLAYPKALTAMSAAGDTTDAIGRDFSKWLDRTGAVVPQIGQGATRDVSTAHLDHWWQVLTGAENRFGALGPTQQVMSRYFPSWDEFRLAIRPQNIDKMILEHGEGINEAAIQRLKSASKGLSTMDDAGYLRRYWLRQMQAGGTAIGDRQVSHMALSPLTSLTGAIARPWDDEIDRVASYLTKDALDRGEYVNRDLIRQRAKEIIGEDRKRFAGAAPFVQVAHNVIDGLGGLVGHGQLTSEFDAMARNGVYHTTEAWRGALRRVMDPAYVDAMREAMSDPRMQRYFSRYVSAGGNLTYHVGDGREVEIQIRNPDGTIEKKPMTARRSNFVMKTFENDPGTYGHDASVRMKMWGADAPGNVVMNASLPYVNPSSVRDLGLRLAEDATPEAYDKSLNELVRYTHDLGPEKANAVARALTDNRPEDYQRARLLIAGTGKSPITATPSVWENAFTLNDQQTLNEIMDLGPSTRGQLAGYIKEAQTKNAEGQLRGASGIRPTIHGWVEADKDADQIAAVEAKLYDPELADDVAASVRSHVGEDGVRVADAVKPGEQPLHTIMVDKQLNDWLLAHPDAWLPDDGDPMNVAGNEILRRFRNGEMTKITMDRLDRQGGGLTPLTSWANTDPRVARELSGRIYTLAGREPTEAAIGRIDFNQKYLRKTMGSVGGVVRLPSGRQVVMTDSVDPVIFDHTFNHASLGTSYRIVNPDEMYYVDAIAPDAPRTVLVNGKPTQLSPRLVGEGHPEAPGITREQAIHDMAVNYVRQFNNQFTAPKTGDVLHNLVVPHRWDGAAPEVGLMGEQRSWGSIRHVYQHSGDQLPEIAGPQWEDARFSPWARTVRFGMDKVVGPGIDAMVRRPMFLHNLAISIDENRGLAQHLLDSSLFGVNHIEHRPGRYIEDAPSEIKSWANDTARIEALDRDPGPLAAFHTAHPSPPIQAAMKRAFPDWQAFTVAHPETFDETVKAYNAARYPILDGTTAERLPRVIEELERYAQRVTGQASEQARMIADSLRTATTDGTGVRLAAFDKPPVTFKSGFVTTTMERGRLHDVLDRARAGLAKRSEDTLPELMTPSVVRATRASPDSPTLSNRLGRAFGTKASMRERTLAGLRGASQEAGTTGQLAQVDNALATATTHAAAHDVLSDPQIMVREWKRLPVEITSPKTPISKLMKSADTPEWLKGLLTNNPSAGADLATLRAGATNLAHADDVVLESALEKAGKRTVPFIKNHDVRSQMASWGNNLMPFEFAQEQFAKQWARTLVHSPNAIHMAQLGYDGLRSSGFAQTDANGNVVITYPMVPFLSEALSRAVGKVPLARRLFGADPLVPVVNTLTGQVKQLTPGFDRMDLPAFGPLASVPANMLSGIFPELGGPTAQILGQNSGVGRSFLSGLLPVTLRRLYSATLGANDSNAEYTTAVMQATALLASEDPDGTKGIFPKETDGPLKQQQFLDRVREYARGLLLSKALVGFIGPASPHVEQSAGDPYSVAAMLHPDLRNTMSELHGDFAKLIGQVGIKAAVQQWLKQMGPGGMAYTVFTTQGSSGAPQPTTAAAADWTTSNAAFLSQYQQAGPWMIPQAIGTDQFDRRAYNEQLALELRTRKTPDDFLKDIYYAASAEQYFKMTDDYHTATDNLDPNDPIQLAKRQDLGARYAANRNGYLLQHPVFAEQLQDPTNALRRSNTVDQMQTALAALDLGADGQYRTPEGGVVPHAAQLTYLTSIYNQYQALLTQLYGVRRSGVTALRAELQQQFRDLGESYVALHPEMNAYWHGVIAPAAGVFLPDPLAQGNETSAPQQVNV